MMLLLLVVIVGWMWVLIRFLIWLMMLVLVGLLVKFVLMGIEIFVVFVGLNSGMFVEKWLSRMFSILGLICV